MLPKPFRTSVDWISYNSTGCSRVYKPQDLYTILAVLNPPHRDKIEIWSPSGFVDLGKPDDFGGVNESEWQRTKELNPGNKKFKLYCDTGELGFFIAMENEKISIQVRGSYFAKDSRSLSPYETLQRKIIPALAEKLSTIFIIQRTDIASDFKDVAWEDLLPDPYNPAYSFGFKAKVTAFGDTQNHRTGHKYMSQRFQLRIYEKLAENKLQKNFGTDKQKYYTEIYKGCTQVSRVELSLLTTRSNKTATECFYSNADEDTFCQQVLTQWSYKHRVRVRTDDKNKSRWPIEPRWENVFEHGKAIFPLDSSETTAAELTLTRVRGNLSAMLRKSASVATSEGINEDNFLKQCREAFRTSSETKPSRDKNREKSARWLTQMGLQNDLKKPDFSGLPATDLPDLECPPEPKNEATDEREDR